MPDELTLDSGALIFATLADVYLSSGMVDEAISVLKDGLSRNPTYTLAKILLGRAYYMKGDIKESLKTLEKIYKETTESENTNLYLGHCYRKLGEYDKAIKYYEDTLKINPENKGAKQELDALKPESVTEERKEAEKIVEPVKEEGTAVGVAVPIGAEEKVEKIVEPEPVVSEEKLAAEEIAEPTKEEEKIEEAPELVKEEEERPEAISEPAKAVEETKVETPKAVEEKVEPAGPTEAVVEEKVPEHIVPFESLDKPMNRLLELKTVKGAFICSIDGLLIQNYYKDRSDIEEVCAMIAAIYNEAEGSFKFLEQGGVEKFIIEKDDETICMIASGESLLTVVTQPETKPGLVFVYARKIIDEIREILG